MRPARYPRLAWGPRGDGDARTAVDIEFASTPAVPQAKAVMAVVDTFCRVAALGGFSEKDVPIGACTCRRLSHEPFAAGVRIELECTGIDTRAFQTLRNMLAALELGSAHVTTLTVAGDALRWPEERLAPEIDEDNEDRTYPPVHPAVRLAYGDDDEAAVASWFRRCLLTLNGPVGQQHLDAVADLVVPWFDLLVFNGYAMPVDWPWDVANTADTVAQFEADSIEVTMLRFQSSEEAWSPLANLLWANAPAIGLPVHSIVVDP